MTLILLILLGAITYFLLKRNVAGLTTTPIWLLWLVIMTPAIIWTAWWLFHGDADSIPVIFILLPLIVCPILYVFLIQWGRTNTNHGQNHPSEPSDSSRTNPSTQENATNAQGLPLGVARFKPQSLEAEEEKRLRDCFPWTDYVLKDLEYLPQVILCRGQLRSNPETAYQTVRDRIEQAFGDRFLVVFQEGSQGKPLFVLFPNPYNQRQRSHPLADSKKGHRPILALSLLLITLFTTTVMGTSFALEFAGQEVSSEAMQDPRNWNLGLPYALSLIFILGMYEVGHYFSARFWQVSTTLPYFIPLPGFLGTLGAFIQLRQLVPHRKSLFDISIAGFLAGMAATLPVLLWGLARSTVVEMGEASGMFNLNSLDPRFSFLFVLLSKLALGSELTENTAIQMHPVAIAGYLGLLLTILKLMPVGQLDGGRLFHAMYGQRKAMAIAQIVRFLMLIRALLDSAFLLFAIFLFLIPLQDNPARNDVSEIDSTRDLIGFIPPLVLVFMLLPPPELVMQWLNL
ncbi:site-2 protease family protein [Geitlerinema sp. PCC 9228]|jgi:membrane-associated protease RseP (regulator of RpoE activity)|uniref:site-2 protease family protein n=1 Tax=Geitlerinema sp. PCC 9228 TaxID=111611 RepID=UPI0008F9E198|nr:site-2 protease family protein [Geitlerinema sp. PCC 9228]